MTTIINLIKSIRFRFDFVLRNEFQWENNFGNIDNSTLSDLLMSKVSRDLICWPSSRDPEPACDWSKSRNVEWRNPLDMTSDHCIIRINEMPGPGPVVRGLTPTLGPGPGSWRVRQEMPRVSGQLLSNCDHEQCEKMSAGCIMWVWPQVSRHWIKISGESETVTNDRVSRFTFDVRAHWD